MATLRINNITLGCTPSGTFSTLIEYRLVGALSYTTLGSFTTNPDGTFTTTVQITGLSEASCYDIRITPSISPALCSPLVVQSCTQPQFIWIADDQECETEGGFGVVKTITGLSSPSNVWYDIGANLVYVADHDSPNGNVYWFNPSTATTEADVTYSTTILQSELYSTHIDITNRRIYFVGRNSGGLTVYDIDTDTVSTVFYGSNVAFSRIGITVTPTRIYCGDNAGGNIVIINRTTLAIVSTVPFSSSKSLISVGNDLYAVNSNNAGGGGDILVYDTNLSLIDTIPLPGAATWTFGNYWQTGFYDPTSTNFYCSDIGSNHRYVIETTGRTIIDTKINNNTSGKSNCEHIWIVNPINNDLLCAFKASNSTSDSSPVTRTYSEDRTTFNYMNMYETQYYTGLSLIDGTSSVMGANPNKVFWVPPNTGYDTDGTVTILSNSAGSDNTGNLITLTLQEVNEITLTPTGDTKPNIPSDPDYIAPVEDTITCPITTDLACPTDGVRTFSSGTVYYEFAIPSTVRFNPSVDNIAIYAYNTVTSNRVGSPTVISDPTLTNFYSGSFTSLGVQNHTVEVVYRSNINAELASCIIA